jgi:hypothetical protein
MAAEDSDRLWTLGGLVEQTSRQCSLRGKTVGNLIHRWLLAFLITASSCDFARAAVDQDAVVAIAISECAKYLPVKAILSKSWHWEARLHGNIWHAYFSSDGVENHWGSENVYVDALTGRVLYPFAPKITDACFIGHRTN